MKKLLLILIIATSTFAQTEAPTKSLEAEDQTKLQSAYKEWQESVKTAETNRIKFQGIMFQIMAEMKVSPKEYDLGVNAKNEFVFTPKKDEKTSKK